jgi:hypothetical protein
VRLRQWIYLRAARSWNHPVVERFLVQAFAAGASRNILSRAGEDLLRKRKMPPESGSQTGRQVLFAEANGVLFAEANGV